MAPRGAGRLAGGGAAALLLGIFIVGGLVFIFAGALARADQLESEAAAARAEVAALEQRRDGGLAEIEYMDTPAFTEQAARAVGYGEPDEQAFRLAPDAPSPAPLPVLGAQDARPVSLAPLDAWLTLLFGG